MTIHPITPTVPVCAGVACERHAECQRYRLMAGGETDMMMKPPTLPADYVPEVHASELVQTLQLILHATAPTPDDGGHHEAAYELAMATLKRVEARREYVAKNGPDLCWVNPAPNAAQPAAPSPGATVRLGA